LPVFGGLHVEAAKMVEFMGMIVAPAEVSLEIMVSMTVFTGVVSWLAVRLKKPCMRPGHSLFRLPP